MALSFWPKTERRPPARRAKAKPGPGLGPHWPWTFLPRNLRPAPPTRRARAHAWLKRHRREALFVGVVVGILGVSGTVVMFTSPEAGRGAGPRGTLAPPALLTATATSSTAASTAPSTTEATLVACLRGAAASAFSAAVPAAPLAATGFLIPGSAALVAAASAVGCGAGAVGTSTAGITAWALRQFRSDSAARP